MSLTTDRRPPRLPSTSPSPIVFAALDFLVMLAYAISGARAVRWLKASATQWLDRACGGALLALAGSLAFHRRANT